MRRYAGFAVAIVILAATTASAGAANVPPDGTYTYTMTRQGSTLGEGSVGFKSDAATLTVESSATLGALAVQSRAIYDLATLHERSYTLAAAGQHAMDAKVEGTTASLILPGVTLPLKSERGAYILIFDGLASSFAALPAIVAKNGTKPFALATTARPRVIEMTVQASAGGVARPDGVPAADAVLTLSGEGETWTLWFDSNTLILDAASAAASGVTFRLVSRSTAVSQLAIPTAAPAATPLPLPPAKYRSSDVAFTSADGTRLAGTITVPSGAGGPSPAIVLLHGSGPLDRDESIGPNKIFLQLANELSNHGYIVLRYDKRGAGESAGTFGTTTREMLLADATAAIAFLRGRPEVDRARLYLLGHSEGGELAPSLAIADRTIRGIILMAPPALPIKTILMQQLTRGLTGQKYEEEYAKQSAAYDTIVGSRSNAVLGMPGPWLRSTDPVVPARLIAQVPSPILVLQGGKDNQVLASDLPTLVDAAKAARRNITVEIFPDDQHEFIKLPSGAAADSFTTVAYPIDPAVPRAILSWLRTH